jgi:hypothetical protein
MNIRDTLHRITGQVAVDVPDNASNVLPYVVTQLVKHNIEISEKCELQCEKCGHWFQFHDYSGHAC